MSETMIAFPEADLTALAEHFENIGKAWAPNTPLGGKLRQENQDRAKVCRDAIAAYEAMRERCVLAEGTDIDMTRVHGAPRSGE